MSGVRSLSMLEFVVRHDLACFVCGSRINEWAKTGTNAKGPWAICLPCVKRNVPPPRAAEPELHETPYNGLEPAPESRPSGPVRRTPPRGASTEAAVRFSDGFQHEREASVRRRWAQTPSTVGRRRMSRPPLVVS